MRARSQLHIPVIRLLLLGSIWPTGRFQSLVVGEAVRQMHCGNRKLHMLLAFSL